LADALFANIAQNRTVYAQNTVGIASLCVYQRVQMGGNTSFETVGALHPYLLGSTGTSRAILTKQGYFKRHMRWCIV
jgi:hypothetical protein